ncbi:MAG: hypothetical protein R3C18_23675 [Planctomycetaceae bacterium]
MIDKESNGADIRSGLEVAQENLAIAVLSKGPAGADYERLVKREVDAINLHREFLEAQREMAKDNPAADERRQQVLSAIEEIQELRRKERHLVEVAVKRQEAIDLASGRGEDIRTDLEKAMTSFAETLSTHPEYVEAAARLKAEQAKHEDADYYTGLNTYAPSVVLRVARLRLLFQAREDWP